MRQDNNDNIDLQVRNDYLEMVNRDCMRVLEMLASIGELHDSRQHGSDIDSLLALVYSHIERTACFDAAAFFIIDEEEGIFTLQACRPESAAPELRKITDRLIESGEFAWALNQNRCVELSNDGRQIVLHVLATQRRIRGMFVGVPIGTRPGMNRLEQYMLSILMHHVAYAMESLTLYEVFHKHRRTLEAMGATTGTVGLNRAVAEDDLAMRLRERTEDTILLKNELRAEMAKRQQLENLLRETTLKLQLSRQAAALGDWEWDLRTDEMTWSDPALAWFGWQPPEARGKSDRFFMAIDDNDRQRVAAEIASAINDTDDLAVKFRVSAGPVPTRQVVMHGHILRNDKGEAYRVIGVAHAIG